MKDPYSVLTSAAHDGAFGIGKKQTPTAAQVRAGNYRKGSMRLHGLPITIETPMFTPRTGKEDGQPWSIVCMANYGYVNGTKAADGDAFDVYVGPVPESPLVVVVNQVKKDGSFDEHKAVLGFHDVDTALTAYLNSYERSWRGLGSYVVCTIRQFKAWLKAGDMGKPLAPDDLMDDDKKAVSAVFVSWGDDQLPVGASIGDVLYGLRRSDHGKLLLEGASMADLLDELSDGSMLDAMVVEYAKFEKKAGQLLRVMQAATGEVKAEAVEVTKPFKNLGTTQVAMLFTMSDGQTVSVFFHNPDSTPNKLAQTDELISWKWVLNKKDITLVVAPERGQDLNPRQVARRVMALVEKNSAKFIKASGASAEKAEQLEALKSQAQGKMAEVERLDSEIAALQAQVDTLPAAPAAVDVSPPPPVTEPQPDMLGDDPALRDGRSNHEKLTEALKAGNTMGALGVLDGIDNVDELREVVLKAGFSLGASGTKDEILGSIGKDLVRAAKAKADGFGLRDLDKAQAPVPEQPDVAAPAAAEPQEPAADDQGDIAPEGRENTVKTAKGTKVVTGFRVIEAKNLVISHEADGTANPDYPAELQPRDRARATSQAWVQKTARSLDPDSLGRTNRADSGAPIVGPDRVVESGNGRAMAIREAYRIGQADEYRAWLLEHADYFKVSPDKIEAMKAPILVRVRVSAVNRAEFAVEANQDDKLAMTATEKARSDAKRLDVPMMAKLADGDLGNASNRDFINAFLQSLGETEAAQYLTSDGRPTSSLISRIQAALFAGAYSDDRLLELTADVSKPEIANIISALNMAAPDFMRAKDLDKVGAETAGEQVADSLELSLDQEAVNAILSATDVLRKAKESGMGLDEFLRQGDMFGGVDPAVAVMATFISRNNRSAKRLGAAFKAMAQFVETEAKRKHTAGLFGDAPASFVDIVKAANEQLEKEFGEGVFAIEQSDLFNKAPPLPSPPPPGKDNGDQGLEDAKAYLDSVIDGSADMEAPDKVMERLEEIYTAYGEGELSGLFSAAADAFSQHALRVTAE